MPAPDRDKLPGRTPADVIGRRAQIYVSFGGPAALILLLELSARTNLADWQIAVVIVVVVLPVAEIVHRFIERAPEAASRALMSAGGKYRYSYSQEEAAVVAGRHRDAADLYAKHITQHPDDIEARFRLYELLEQHLRDHAAAEATLLEIRRVATHEAWQRRADRCMIDLHELTRHRGKLMAELARYAARWPGTDEAIGARRRLAELKAEGAAGTE